MAAGGKLKNRLNLLARDVKLLHDLIDIRTASKFSKTTDTGRLVFLKTHAPLSLSGTLSTAGHWDQSRVAAIFPVLPIKVTSGSIDFPLCHNGRKSHGRPTCPF